MTHILEDLTHKMEGQPPKKDVIWVLGMYVYIYIYTFIFGQCLVMSKWAKDGHFPF